MRPLIPIKPLHHAQINIIPVIVRRSMLPQRIRGPPRVDRPATAIPKPGIADTSKVMTSHASHLEVVRIATDFRLFDEESYQRRYSRRDGIPLEPGTYVVQWPPGMDAKNYDERTSFHGPFPSWETARAKLRELHSATGQRANAKAASGSYVAEWVMG
ncbi:putative uncharacterized protein [Burkholderiales bacterium GJ-E10]|nr:putative uncharacterized protein [Burkholderiales bacterium GJ-E10]